MLDISADMDWVLDLLGMKGYHIVWWKLRLSTYRGLNSKTFHKIKVKKLCGWLVHFAKMQQLKMVLIGVWALRACMHAWQHHSGPAPNEMSNGFPSPPRSVRRSELLDSLAFNLAVLDLGQVSMSASLKQWVQGFHSIS